MVLGGNNKSQMKLSLQHHVRDADLVVPHEKWILKNTDKIEFCSQLGPCSVPD